MIPLLPVLLQISDTITVTALVGEAIFTSVAALISYYALKKTPPLQTETQQAIVKIVTDFEEHKTEDNKRFSDIWDKLNESQRDSAAQASRIELQIAAAALSNVKELTDIKVSLGNLSTSMTFVKAQIELGLIEKPMKDT